MIFVEISLGSSSTLLLYSSRVSQVVFVMISQRGNG